MASGLDYLAWNGYLLFFLYIVANRIGVPIPATPALLVAGALAGLGELKYAAVLLVVCTGTLISDTVWFHLGRKYGLRILNRLCRVALEPDWCVRNAEGFLVRHGAKSLLISKFVPGMNRTVLPLTGAFRLTYPKFLAYDIVGAAVWAASYTGIGYIFSDELERALHEAKRFGWYALVVIAALIMLAFVLFKYLERRRALKEELAVERITPQELHHKFRAGEPVAVLDLRNPLDVLPDARTLPGAVRVDPDQLKQRQGGIPRDRDVVLYCT